jgi:ATP adenylyltransferase
MQHMWAPWRMAYLTGHGPTGCVFCQKVDEHADDANLIVTRRERCFVTMNLYPYNNGHLMVVPYRHVASLEDLAPEELLDLMATVNLALAGLRNSMSPAGFNIGVNLGKAAGAGIDTHVHVHVVPRWAGDTNFMPVVADVRVVPESLIDTCRKVRQAIEAITTEQQGEG